YGSDNAFIGGVVPKGLKLVNTSNFSTPNYAVASFQSYFQGSPGSLTAPSAHTACGLLCAVPQNGPTPGTGGGSSLPPSVTQGGVTYYRNSSGLLSPTQGH